MEFIKHNSFAPPSAPEGQIKPELALIALFTVLCVGIIVIVGIQANAELKREKVRKE